MEESETAFCLELTCLATALIGTDRQITLSDLAKAWSVPKTSPPPAQFQANLP